MTFAPQATPTDPPLSPEEAIGSGDRARVAARLSADYLLRVFELLSRWADGDLMLGVLALAIMQINIGHVTREDLGAYADITTPPPDALRRPASVLAVANSLGLPYETTRRQIAKLVGSGRCIKVRGGVIVPTDQLATLAHADGLMANLANLRRLYRGLKAAGVDLD